MRFIYWCFFFWQRDFLQASKDLSVAQLMYAAQAGVGDVEQLVAAEPFASQRGNSLCSLSV